MECEKKIKIYHGTSLTCAQSIEKGNFRLPTKPDPNSNDEKKKNYYEYWLGPGVYMFKDKKAAQWWSTHPSKTYGSAGTPAVMECHVELTSNSVDLTLAEGIELLHREYETFRGYLKAMRGKVTISCGDYRDKDETAVLRCAFFKWFQKRNSFDVIIANFIPKEMPYVPNEHKKSVADLGLVYNETQYCIYNVGVIKSKTIM